MVLTNNEQEQSRRFYSDGTIRSDPSVVLFVNRSSESQIAFDFLEKSGIPFQVKISPKIRHPKTSFGSDIASGVLNIRNMIDALHAFKITFMEETRKTSPELFEKGDPEVAREAKEFNEDDLRRAREVMSHLFDKTIRN
ncbi:hypothetical protein M1563_03710 [Patescibacteria group bacterium]|nr:hypothetical protein [Patescibacteria group bacterium]